MPASLARRLAVGGAAALALAAAAPAAASADSILHIRGGEIWLASSDGARQFQVATGGWAYASQSDDGSVIVASRGRQLFVLNRNGDVVRELPTVIGSIWWQGPFEPQVSPDGRHVAYQYFTTTTGEVATGVAYADVDGSMGTHELHTGWGYPAWVDNETLMHSDPPNALSLDVIIRRLDEPNNRGDQWFRHDELDLRDGDIRGGRMAFVGSDGRYLAIYRWSGPAPGSEAAVDYCYHHRDPAGRFEGPSFAPDSRALAWGEADGIWVGPVGEVENRCEQPTSNGALVIPGGRYPDWSAADVPPARDPGPISQPPPPGPPPSRDPPRPTPRTVPRDVPRTVARLTPAATRLAAALRRGLVVRVSGGRRVALTATVSAATARKARLGRRAVTVARGSGSGTVRLRFTATAAKRLKRLPKVALTISGGGLKATATLKR